ncbi:TPA: hypothetical protein ACXJAF_002822 [Pseudomonas aeruginosa]
MTQLYVEDISFGDVCASAYDVSIFCCGYEERCTYLASVIERTLMGDMLVFDFSDEKLDVRGVRERNENFFQKVSGRLIEVSYGQAHVVVENLRQSIEQLMSVGKESATILVDYSSMPKLWTAEILNFFKNYSAEIELVFDFIYSVGEHIYSDRPRQLRDPIVLPGCEAVATYNKKTVAIFGLGFDSGAPVCIHQMIEPDVTFALVARPGLWRSMLNEPLQ